MTDDTSAAVERLRLYIEYDGGALPLADARTILAHIAALEARAKEAEAKVAAAEERGLVFNTLPDGRLDFCAIREGSRLWDGRVRAEKAEAEAVRLREALEKIADEHWYRNGYCQTDIGVEPACSAEEAQKIAREALAAYAALARKMGGRDVE